MRQVYKAQERGVTKLNWLTSYHTFSFGQFYDEKKMGFESLRVINEDFVTCDHGFGAHPHKEMEIITLVLEGQIAHKDNQGNEEILNTNQMQRMSAGTGVIHSEFNPSDKNPLHFLQIWILPDEKNLTPSYENTTIPDTKNEWVLLASKQNGLVKLHQKCDLFYLNLESSHSIQVDKSTGYFHIIEGKCQINEDLLNSSDGLAIQNESLEITTKQNSRVLYFKFY